MKRCQLNLLATATVALVGLWGPGQSAQAESPSYQSPSFYGVGQAGGGQYPPQAAFPASPLAGGAPAAQGDAFMDAHRRPIVMPASFHQGCSSCPGGAYGSCAAGDPMAVDFGGQGQDQCGPHYFDVSVETVFLKSEDLVGDGLPAFSSLGVGGAPPPANTPAPRLNPDGQSDEYEPGWQIAVRYDLGPLSVLEATYMGLYDYGFSLSTLGNDNLFSIFSQYGVAPVPGVGGFGIDGLDRADQHTLSYKSDLQSTEFSYRRYWVGHHPGISGTWLAGFRYVRMTEDFTFSAHQIDVLGQRTLTGGVDWSSENDLLGFQLGGDAWACVRQGMRVGVEGKTGVYNNRFKFGANNNSVSAVIDPQLPEDGNQVAFVAEGGVSFVVDILPSWSLKGGYEALYINSVVALQDNIDTTQYFNGGVASNNPRALAPALNTQGSVFYHGFHGGVEYVW